MSHIVVVGSINLDIVGTVSRLPEVGETVTDANIKRFPGGKGANQALAVRRLGADVTLLGCVGADSNADEALILLRDAGVNLENLLKISSIPTGVALIIVDNNGDNQIVVGPGANGHLTPEKINLPESDAIICQLEIPIETVSQVSRDYNGFLCINLAPSREICRETLSRADLLVVNETESQWYGEKLSICKGFVATTYGADGASLKKNGIEIARCRPPKVNSIDTTGAGDTFTAALTVALVDGQSARDALVFACKAGAIATTKLGAQPSIPMRKEIEELVI